MIVEDQTTLAELYEQSVKEIKDGQIVPGKIVALSSKEVMVDIGYKSEGVIALSEFPDPKALKLGQDIEVYIENKEDDHGMIILSREKAERLKGWNKITDTSKEGDAIDGVVKRKVKGGYIVDIYGIEGFVPASLSSFRGMLDKDIMHKTFKFKIIKMNTLRRSVILSRKDALKSEREGMRTKLWEELKVGQVCSGVVKGITDFGAFIDLGGVDGLLHIMDMSWSRISHPSELVALGDKIEVMILNVDKEASKVSLGLKQRSPDPWEEVENKFPVGSRHKGKVVNILNYGVFVELEKGIEGLIHISEISWQKRIQDVKDIFAIGDMTEVQVLNIDKKSRRISLSIKQIESNPWLDAEAKFPVDSKISGKVKGFTDYGAFVELDSNLEGMIHISDMSWTKKINHPQDVLKKGQKAEVVVLSVDGANRRISLGLKQLTPNPWSGIADKYPVGMDMDSEVIQINNFGVFVKLEDDIEGLVYISEIDKEEMDKLKPGDKLKVRIFKVDAEQGKIGLTAKLI
ncbi:MAG TPA: 30S ribosomal protein S1 [Candidatus Omnitrophica bacterium]|nr:30S ribosomal protein S1 [Candidatus Omnitrophota bacterium]